MNIGIYIYDDAEVLDFSGPFEVFSTASRVCEHSEPFNTFLISESGKSVDARAGFKVTPSFSIDNHPTLDALIIAGGVHTGELKKSAVIDWLKNQHKKVDITASVCTGAFLLAEAGIISDHSVTTHWEDIPDLRKDYPQLKVVENVRWVDQKNIITSAGISAGIDMSLFLVEKLHDHSLAQKTAKQMDFDWTKNE